MLSSRNGYRRGSRRPAVVEDAHLVIGGLCRCRRFPAALVVAFSPDVQARVIPADAQRGSREMLRAVPSVGTAGNVLMLMVYSFVMRVAWCPCWCGQQGHRG